jgi:hypothetical protein
MMMKFSESIFNLEIYQAIALIHYYFFQTYKLQLEELYKDIFDHRLANKGVIM